MCDKMKIIVTIVFGIWELPQNIIGGLLWMINHILGKNREMEVRRYRLIVRSRLGISLGFFVFWTYDPTNRIFKLLRVNKEHEYGHSLQSRMLGPFYLLIIGLPSAIRAMYARMYYGWNRKMWANYYKGFPERWADKLGHVDSSSGKRRLKTEA